ncbi:hypothetical protein PAMA_008242 [Pampus argenteus]
MSSFRSIRSSCARSRRSDSSEYAMELSGSGFSRVLVVLRALEILSDNRDDLQELIDHGLTSKMLSWFESVRDLLTSDLQKTSAPLLSLTEGFYDYFLISGGSSCSDSWRIYTFPCRRAFLDSTELFRPKDDKLDEFWIDFNLDSRCVSFFIDEPQGFLWGSVHLLREDVDHYRVQLKHDECTGTDTVLSIRLNNPIMHLNSRGQTVKMTFDPEHHKQLEEAAGRVFMLVKQVPTEGSGKVRTGTNMEEEGTLNTIAQAMEEHLENIHSKKAMNSDSIRYPSSLRCSSSVFSEQRRGVLCNQEGPHEGVEPSLEEEGLFQEWVESSVKREEAVNMPEPDLTSGITAAFKTFKAQLEQHFTNCWQKVKADVHLSLKECQQHVSSLLTAVHQHRLVLLQNFENSVTDQLNQLEENSASLNSINTQILSFFQSEMERLGSFCEEQQQRSV